jgi:hypothetical protein
MTYPRVAFDIITPANADALGANIAHARSLGLPQADDAEIKTLNIIANGPSATLYDFDAPGDTLAVNGALKHFTDRGKAPTFWACCDPQALVADFLTDPPLHTIYLIASKCHPLVFQMLQGRDVRLWDIDDHPATKEGCRAVAVASSVTLCIQTLMSRPGGIFGYRHFEIYGWDACFGEGLEHHAGQHSETRPDNYVQVTVGASVVPPPQIPAWLLERHRFPDLRERYVGGRTFETSHTWAAEAQDAVLLTHYADYSVNLHGDGLVKAILESR